MSLMRAHPFFIENIERSAENKSCLSDHTTQITLKGSLSFWETVWLSENNFKYAKQEIQ